MTSTPSGTPASVFGSAAPAVPAAAPAPDGDSTGDAAVDGVIGALREVASLPPREQVAVYADAHRTLQQTLNSIEER